MNWILWAYNITTWQLGIVIIGATKTHVVLTGIFAATIGLVIS